MTAFFGRALRALRVARCIPQVGGRLQEVTSVASPGCPLLRVLHRDHQLTTRSIRTSATLFVKGQPIKMPSLSPTMAEGTIVKWYKSEGDTIAPGDVLCDIQTDKAIVGYEMEEEGVLAKILKPENSADVKVGTLIALMVEEGADWKSVEIPASAEAESQLPVDKAEASSSPTSVASPAGGHVDLHGLTGVGPAVRNLLEAYKLTPDAVGASGPGGRLTKGDVLGFVKAKGLQPVKHADEPPPRATTQRKETQKAGAPPSSSQLPSSSPAPYVDVPLSTMRSVIAKRLSESKSTIPHTYATVEADITGLLSERKRLKAVGVNVSVNDFVVKAVAEALMRCPNVNVLYKNGQILRSPTIDISVAVATDQGLITPIVARASRKNIETISAEVRELAAKAKANKLKPEEFQGGSFTISNLGMYGILEFTAIINLPQCAILAVGGGVPVLGADGNFRQMMRSSLSYDARAIGDDDAAEFLDIYRSCLETPEVLLRGSAGSTRQRHVEIYSN